MSLSVVSGFIIFPCRVRSITHRYIPFRVCDTCFFIITGVHASVVCQALVSTATITSGAWMHIIPKLMEYLDNTANTQQMLVCHAHVVISFPNQQRVELSVHGYCRYQ